MFYLWPTEGFWVSTCPPGDFAGIEILGRGHVIQTCCWLPQMFVAAAFGAKLWSCEYRQVVESGYVCARARALVNHLGFAIEITYTPMHNIMIYMYTTCAYDFSMYIYNIQPCNLKLAILLGGKKQIFPSKRRSGRSCSWTHGILPAILVTLGHLGSPSSTTWNFLYIPGRSDLAPVSDSELVAPPVELKTIRLPTEDGSEHERCNGDREKSGCLGQLKDMIRRDSWCFKIVRLALAWVRLAAELFMVSIKVLQSQVRAVYCPCRTKGGCGGGWFCWPKFFHDRFRAKYVASEAQANVLLLDLASSGNTSVELCI